MTSIGKALERGGTAAVVLLAAACGAPAHKPGAAIYFPPSPELPRIQYLTSMAGSKDVEAQSAFNRFVVGERANVRLDKPYGVAIFDGRIYVCDTNATVIVFDLKRKMFETLKGAAGPGKLVQPINISIDGDGIKYVSDPGRSQVVVFDANDEYVKAYGLTGAWRPVDAVPFEDRLYVADVANSLVKVFDKPSGELVKVIGDKGDPSERLDRPTNLAFDGEGFLYVTDFGRFQVVKFDRDGHFKATFGLPGDGPGHFARPKGIALDRRGLLYAIDSSYSNVQIFDKNGRVLLFFGQGGEEPSQLLLPAKVALDYDNLEYFRPFVGAGFEVQYLILVTSQFGPNSVSVFGYGVQKGKKYPTEEELIRQIDEKKKAEAAKQQPKENEATPKEPEKPD